MSQSDSEFIEQEARQENVRQQTLLHIMQQQTVLVAALNQTLVTRDELMIFVKTYENYATQLREQAERMRGI